MKHFSGRSSINTSGTSGTTPSLPGETSIDATEDEDCEEEEDIAQEVEERVGASYHIMSLPDHVPCFHYRSPAHNKA